MFGLEGDQLLYVVVALLVQAVLVVYFAFRKWHFDFALRHGWIVYALGVPAAFVSVVLLAGGEEFSFWVGGFLYLGWAALGYTADYARAIPWRGPIYWPVFAPYVFLYLATLMFYWWPLALVSRPLWYVAAVLFVIGTGLNVTSHGRPKSLDI